MDSGRNSGQTRFLVRNRCCKNSSSIGGCTRPDHALLPLPSFLFPYWLMITCRFNQSTNQPIRQSVSQSVSQSVNAAFYIEFWVDFHPWISSGGFSTNWLSVCVPDRSTIQSSSHCVEIECDPSWLSDMRVMQTVTELANLLVKSTEFDEC